MENKPLERKLARLQNGEKVVIEELDLKNNQRGSKSDLSSGSNARIVDDALSNQLPFRMFDVQLAFAGRNIWAG